MRVCLPPSSDPEAAALLVDLLDARFGQRDCQRFDLDRLGHKTRHARLEAKLNALREEFAMLKKDKKSEEQ